MPQISRTFSSFVSASLALLAAVCILPFSFLPYQGMDSATYFLESLLLTQGGLPYLSAVENKSPGIFFILYPVAWLFGWNLYPAILMARLVDFLMLVTFWRFTKELIQHTGARIIATGALFCAHFYQYAAGSGFRPEFASTILLEPVLNLCCLLALLFAIRGYPALHIGLLIGCSFVVRQTAVIDLLNAAVAIAIFQRPGARGTLTSTFKLAIGFALPVAVLALIAFWQGWLIDWWRYAFVWGARYSATSPIAQRATLSLLDALKDVSLLPFLIGGILWIVALSIHRSASSHRNVDLFLALFAALKFVEMVLPGRIFPHHLLVVLPPMAAILARGLDIFLSQSSAFGKRAVSVPLAVSLLASLAAHIKISGQTLEYWGTSPPEVSIGEWIRRGTTSNDKILVWGYSPEIYLNSQRLPASRHIHNMILNAVNEQYGQPDEREVREFDAELSRTKPKYVLLLSPTGIEKYSRFITDNYELKSYSENGLRFRYYERPAVYD